ncbi:MAG: DNA-directed RNA polymerase subunit A' [Candidatus Pacearchaeota archaeon]
MRLLIPLRKQVREIGFKLLSPEEIKRLAKVKVITPELYDVDGYPVDGGLMDLHMGAIDPGVKCRTCGGSFKECLGHFGYIELARPVLHIHFIPIIELLLKTTCEACGRILTTKKLTLAEIKKLRAVKKCPHCGAIQSKIKLEKPYFFYKGQNRMFPTEIREWLAKIPNEDLLNYKFNPETFRPENAVLTVLLIPPVTIRPSITLETGERSEDDLTHKIGDIVRSNQRLIENINAGAPEVIIEDLWDLLQYHVATFIDNEISQLPPARHRGGQPLKTLSERIRGKEGHIRHNLAGKRVNYSSRSVISPDPKIEINEVGVPYEVAKVLTTPERVTVYNIDYLKRLISNYPNYPSAEYVIRPNGQKKKITEETKEEIIAGLEIGSIVERHIQDGDVVLFNRHPSLHKYSLMAHFVKVLKGKTFRLHPAICFPYNADFDGDEMNIHAPQSEEAISEAITLLNSADALIGVKNNTNLIGCTREAITGCYLLSKATLEREEAIQLLLNANVELEKIEELKDEKVSGLELFSVLLPKNLNFEIKTRECKGKDCPNCSKPGSTCKLVIKNGKIIRGVIDSNSIGTEKEGLIKELDKILPRDQVIKIVKQIFGLGLDYVTKHGFSLSVSDIKPSTKISDESQKIIKKAYAKVNEIIEQAAQKKLDIIPSKTLEETREIKIIQILNEARSEIGEIIKANIEPSNPVNILITSGAVGNILNLTQMSGFVGQQALWAWRINIGYRNRTLSLFKQNDLSPEARGFIASCYYSGLNPYEFFFNAITGRDGLMDTALRTPKSGYLYRRLVNALQDLRVEYDGTVRDSGSRIVQFIYGEDGVDVSKAHRPNPTIEPAEAIGVVTSQSFGEPATQMTLNVFHFAGVSEMQITVGLPRLIEIFDARKRPSTPQMEVYLDKEHNNEDGAKKIAERIKQILLKDVTSEILVDYANRKIQIVVDKASAREKGLTIEKIMDAIKIKDFRKSVKENTIILTEIEKASEKKKTKPFSDLYKLKEKLKSMIIGGIPDITQIFITKRGKDYVILTAGSNLREVIKVKGVDPDRTITNDIYEMAEVFGIEAARECIIREVKNVLKKQGIEINERHIKLVADVMTMSGEIKGVTRTGIIEDKKSILARASFEIPIRQFVRATLAGIRDEMISVIENVMLNQPVPVGTGLPGLLVKVTDMNALAMPPKK